MLINKYLYKISTVVLALGIPSVSFAATLKLVNPTPGAGSTLKDFVYLLLDIMQLFGIPILTMCIIYAGFLIVTASGNEEQVTKAKTWFLWTAVGAAIILGAEPLADMVYGTAALF